MIFATPGQIWKRRLSGRLWYVEMITSRDALISLVTSCSDDPIEREMVLLESLFKDFELTDYAIGFLYEDRRAAGTANTGS